MVSFPGTFDGVALLIPRLGRYATIPSLKQSATPIEPWLHQAVYIMEHSNVHIHQDFERSFTTKKGETNLVNKRT